MRNFSIYNVEKPLERTCEQFVSQPYRNFGFLPVAALYCIPILHTLPGYF